MLKGSNKKEYQKEYMRKKRGTLDISILPPDRVERITELIERRKEMSCDDIPAERWQRAIEYRKWEVG